MSHLPIANKITNASGIPTISKIPFMASALRLSLSFLFAASTASSICFGVNPAIGVSPSYPHPTQFIGKLQAQFRPTYSQNPNKHAYRAGVVA